MYSSFGSIKTLKTASTASKWGFHEMGGSAQNFTSKDLPFYAADSVICCSVRPLRATLAAVLIRYVVKTSLEANIAWTYLGVCKREGSCLGQSRFHMPDLMILEHVIAAACLYVTRPPMRQCEGK